VRDVTLTLGGVVTRFYSITVYTTSDKYVEPTDEVIDAAENYNIDAVYFYWDSSSYSDYTDSYWHPLHIQKTIQVSYAEDGFVYLQGLAYWKEDAWVKGVLDAENNQIIIEPQLWYDVDDYGYEGATYFVGFDKGMNPCAAVIDIIDNGDGTKTLQLNNYIAENAEVKDAWAPYGYYGQFVVNDGEYTEPEPLVVPEGLETTEFILDGQNRFAMNIRHSLQISNPDEEGVIYIQGLCMYIPEAWVKANVTDTDEEGNPIEVTIPAKQYLGEDDYGFEIWLNDNSWYPLYDIVLTFDPATKTYTTTQKFYFNEFTRVDAIGQVNDITPYIVPDVVELPEGLKVDEFYFTRDGELDGTRNVAVDMANGKVYIQGLSELKPEAWLVGEIDTENDQIILKANQYLGQAEDGTDLWVNFHGDDYVLDFDFDPYLALDTENAELATTIEWNTDGEETINFNQKWKDEYWEGNTDLFTQEIYEQYLSDLKLVRVQTLVPDMPEIQAVNAIMVGDGVVEISFNINKFMTIEDALGAEEQVAIADDQLSYELFFEKDGEWQPLVFSTELYTDLAENQSEFKLDEAYDGIQLGKIIIKDNVVGEWTKIGLKTYNRVTETVWRESEMAEVVLKNIATGINEIVANENVSYTDMQGRQAKASAKGLLIKQVRTADGNVKNVKVVRK
jgi:hypothetical protein